MLSSGVDVLNGGELFWGSSAACAALRSSSRVVPVLGGDGEDEGALHLTLMKCHPYWSAEASPLQSPEEVRSLMGLLYDAQCASCFIGNVYLETLKTVDSLHGSCFDKRGEGVQS